MRSTAEIPNSLGAMAGTALVIGAQGVLGAFISRGLAAEGWNVRRGGRRPESVPDFTLVDLDRPGTVERAIDEADLLVNCVPDDRLVAERIALGVGATLLNIGSLRLAARREMEEQRGDGPGLVVVHGGLTPGVTTLVFKELLARFPEADGLEYAWASSAAQSSGRAGAALVANQLGTRRRREVKTVDFPDPIGRRRCIEWGRGEEGWFGAYPARYDCRAWFFLGPSPVMAAMRALNRIGGLGLLKPRLLAIGHSRIPRSPSAEPKRDLMAVTRRGRQLGAYAMNGEGDYATTVAATLALIEALMGDGRGPSGVHGVDDLFELKDLLPGLERRGVSFVEL